MPFETASDAVNAPEYKSTPAPEVNVPTAACVIVFEPAVHAPKVIAPTLLIVWDAIDHPPDVRATATRA